MRKRLRDAEEDQEDHAHDDERKSEEGISADENNIEDDDNEQLQDGEDFFTRPRRLKTSQAFEMLDYPTYHSISFPTRHTDQKKVLNDFYSNYTMQWIYELKCGFNLHFYGFGDKRKLLRRIANRYGEKYMEIDAYNGNLTYKEFMSCSAGIKVFVIHNVEGIDDDKLNSHLFSAIYPDKDIKVIMSTDHLNSFLLFDASKVAKMKLLHHAVSTFLPYDFLSQRDESNEFLFPVSGVKAKRNLRSLRIVLDSLTSNARGMYMLLIKSDGEMSIKAYYEKAERSMFVSSLLSFKAHLNEFIDHEMLKKKYEGNEEFVYIPFEKPLQESLIDLYDIDES